jgi:DNA polymerase III epsilon subunit-like protein
MLREQKLTTSKGEYMKPYSILNNVIFLDIETSSTDDKIIKICAVKIKKKCCYKVQYFS